MTEKPNAPTRTIRFVSINIPFQALHVDAKLPRNGGRLILPGPEKTRAVPVGHMCIMLEKHEGEVDRALVMKVQVAVTAVQDKAGVPVGAELDVLTLAHQVYRELQRTVKAAGESRRVKVVAVSGDSALPTPILIASFTNFDEVCTHLGGKAWERVKMSDEVERNRCPMCHDIREVGSSVLP